MAKKTAPENRPKTIYGILILISLFLISSCTASILSISNTFSPEIIEGNVVQIPITGVITGTKAGSMFQNEGAYSTEIIEKLEKAKNSKKVKGVILEINSPGGSPVASDEISQAVKELGKPSVAWIREVGASGAYWIATSSDHIIANRMSITGSIGVYGSYLEFPDLLNRYNISYKRLVSGKYKDAGVPFRELEDEEEEIIQGKLDTLHDFFIEEVALNRELEEETVRDAATGMFYLGSEAIEMGLIDELGGKKEAIRYLEQQIGTNVTIYVYEREPSFIDFLAELVNEHAYNMGRGMSSYIREANTFRVIT
ncbi:MAG: signal peptide peptidase SppA [Nanoarchaeota archaeon]|nr:signal peptide peptidase SppA [Nanoarchaeota archaeon]